MRTVLLTIALAVAGLFGLGYTAPAHADGVRVFVDFGDVYFTAGRPYYRHTHQPLYVMHHAYGPRYYYSRPAYPVDYRYGYAPRPAYYGYGIEYRSGHHHRRHYGYRDHDRYDGYRGRGHHRDGYRGRDRDDDHRGDRRGDHDGHGRRH